MNKGLSCKDIKFFIFLVIFLVLMAVSNNLIYETFIKGRYDEITEMFMITISTIIFLFPPIFILIATITQKIMERHGYKGESDG